MLDQIPIAIRQTPVASFIMLLTVVTSILAFRNRDLMEKLVLRPYAFVHRRQHFTIVSSGLIHGDWQHLIFNMLTFYFFAFELEHGFLRLETQSLASGDDTGQWVGELLGHAKFLVFYFGCMVIADLTTIFKYKTVPSYSCLGASGALSGVVIGYILLAPAVHSTLAQLMLFGVIPGWMFAVLYILGSYFAARQGMVNRVAHEAHLWGTLGGIVLSVVMYPKACWTFVESVAQWWDKVF